MKDRMKSLLIGVALALYLAAAAPANLSRAIDGIIAESLEKSVHFSIHVVQAESGRTIYDHDAKELMVPASNMKLITSAAALHHLGAGFEYRTKVGLCGDTLVVIGSGDPLLGDEKTDAAHGRERGWIFKDIAETLRRRRMTTINDLIVDSSVFDDQRVHPSWPKDQLNQWYACEVSGVNYNDNCIDVTVKNTRGRIAISIEPQTAFIRATNKIVPTSSAKDSAVGAYRTREPNKIIFKGKCRRAVGPFYVAIERPAGFFGFLLAERLAGAGIKTRGHVIEKRFDDLANFKPLAEYKTPIADCLTRCNKNSLGLAAEALFKTIAAHSKPDRKDGSWTRGQEVVAWYLLGLGLDKSQFYIDDGSGLSRQNELTAYTVTTVLRDMYKGENWKIYKSSLAVGGVDGTIARYFNQEKYEGKILGKTGYISGVKSFSGICLTDDGHYIFSILANNARGDTRTVINSIAEAIVDNFTSDKPEAR